MKNLLKKINVFGLALILAAGAVFVTQSAFKSTETLANKVWGNLFVPTSGMIPSHYEWVDVTSLINDENEGDYACDGATKVCTAQFPETVDPNNQSSDSYPGTALPSNEIDGEFYFLSK